MLRWGERSLDFDSLDPCEGVRHMISFIWRYFHDHPGVIQFTAACR